MGFQYDGMIVGEITQESYWIPIRRRLAAGFRGLKTVADGLPEPVSSLSRCD